MCRYETERLSDFNHISKFLHALAACAIVRQVHLCFVGSSAFMTRYYICTVMLARTAVNNIDRYYKPFTMSHAASRAAWCIRSRTSQLRPGCLFLSPSGDIPDLCPPCLAAQGATTMIVAGDAGPVPRSLPGTTVILASDNPRAPTAPAPPDHRPNAFPELMGEHTVHIREVRTPNCMLSAIRLSCIAVLPHL